MYPELVFKCPVFLTRINFTNSKLDPELPSLLECVPVTVKRTAHNRVRWTTATTLTVSPSWHHVPILASAGNHVAPNLLGHLNLMAPAILLGPYGPTPGPLGSTGGLSRGHNPGGAESQKKVKTVAKKTFLG